MSDDRREYRKDGPSGEGGRGEGGGRRGGGRGMKMRKKVCPFILDKTLLLDYKNLKVVYRFVSETGRIVPRRVSGVTTKSQRYLSKHIKRARNIGLIAPKMEI